MNIRLIAAAVAVLICTATMADEPQYSAAFTTCVEKSGGVTVEMLDCSHAEYEFQDKKLNDTYRALVAVLSKKDGAALRTSQRDWLKASSSTCNFHSRVSGGTMAALNTKSCFLEEAARRASLLAQWKSLKDLAKQ